MLDPFVYEWMTASHLFTLPSHRLAHPAGREGSFSLGDGTDISARVLDTLLTELSLWHQRALPAEQAPRRFSPLNSLGRSIDQVQVTSIDPRN